MFKLADGWFWIFILFGIGCAKYQKKSGGKE
jgi:hypothetical protein